MPLQPGPSIVSFPLVETGTVAVDGSFAGPARIRGDVLYLSTQEGLVYAVGMTSRRILWRFASKDPQPEAPEIGKDYVYVRDAPGLLIALDTHGRAALTLKLPARPATSVREYRGRLYFGSGDGRLICLDPGAGGGPVWDFKASGPVVAGPEFSGERIFVADARGKFYAVDLVGKRLWTFDPGSPVTAAPASAGGRVYFGTAAGDFYALDEATGKKKWIFRLGAAPSHPACVSGDRLVLAAANSVVYCFSARGGEILWWRNVPARIVHAPVVANGTVLLTGLGPGLMGVDLATGKPSGLFGLDEEPVAEPVWIPPRLAVLESPAPDGRSRIALLAPDVRLSAGAEPTVLSAPGKAVEIKAASSGFDHPLYEFYVVEDGRLDRRQGPSARDSWTWRPPKAGAYTLSVRAFDRFQSREARLRLVVENGPGKH